MLLIEGVMPETSNKSTIMNDEDEDTGSNGVGSNNDIHHHSNDQHKGEDHHHYHQQQHDHTDDDEEAVSSRRSLSAPDMEARKESRIVFSFKVALLAILCTCTVCVAVSVYYYTTDEEDDEFRNRFHDSAVKVLEAIGSSLFLSLGALDSFAVGTTAFASTLTEDGSSFNVTLPPKSSPWPFVTTPNFAVRAAKLKSIAKAFIIIQYNFVETELKSAWEEYSLLNDGWVPEGMQVQQKDPNFDGLQLPTWEPQPTIYNNWEGTSTSQGPYMVSWESYPVVPNYPAYNWDVLSFHPFQKSWPEIQKGRVALRCSNIPDAVDEEAMIEAGYTNDWAESYLPDGADSSEPQIEVYYPITTHSGKQVVQYPPDDSVSPAPEVVGTLSFSIYWRNLIIDILPYGSGGVDAVFRFGPSVFTYSIDGPNVTYLGQGDRHDRRFDHLEESGRLRDLATASNLASYTGLPLSPSMQDYTVHIYPSASMEDHFTTKNPGFITALTVVIFVFTSCVFLVYDRLVERRQRKVIRTAIQSRENVFLLEEMVRERTNKLEASNAQLEEANRRVVQASEQQLKHFACMSHEIRTPLNCIIGLSSLIEESEELNPLQRDSMQMIVSSGDLLRAVVDDVLDYSKLTTGNVDVDVKVSNLQQILGSVVHSVEMRGLATDVTIETYYDYRVPEFVTTDTRRVQQILYNLLGNAVKFSRNGGTVDFGICIAEPGFGANAYSPPLDDDNVPEPASVVVASSKVLRFSVKDYGKGIASEDYPKIFKPFIQTGERVDNENIYGGTGLGLPITVKLVHAFGGSISVESRKGEWTEFIVDLPFVDDVVDMPTLALGLKNVIVLLVTDQARKRQTILENLHYFHIDYHGYESMVELKTALENKLDFLSSSRSIILLVQEELFDESTFEILSVRAPSSLITFGPKFSVEKANGHHRSLTKMLPSALVSSMLVSLEPLERKQVPHYERRLSKVSAVYRSLRFLIAEDNLVNQKVLRNILGRLGIENIVVVENGRMAVYHEAAEPFDGGIDACRLINERRGGHPRAKVVFVTAHVQDNFREECRQAGAVGYLPKPCTLNGVKEFLENLVMTGT